MGELARRRRARDLWISRSHVMAAAAGVAVLTVVVFGSGYLMGRGDAQLPAAAAIELASAVPDGALVELLARVESSAASRGGVEDLTFPDALRGDEGGGFVPAMGPAPVEDEPLLVQPVDAPEFSGDPLPAGRYTVELLRTGSEAQARSLQEQLVADGLDAFVAVELVDGRVLFRLGVGGYRTEEAATSALAEVLLVLGERPVSPSVGLL